MVKLGELVAPAGTATEMGTPATPGHPLTRLTVAPPGGAGPLRTTRLTVVEVPPVTAAGESITFDTARGFTVSLSVLMTLPYLVACVVRLETCNGAGDFRDKGKYIF